MQELGTIVYADADIDDQYLLKLAIAELGYKSEVHCFVDGNKMVEFLQAMNNKPFIIICDLNVHGLAGLDLRNKINDLGLKFKSIPFVFFSQIVRLQDVNDAYMDLVQGFFRKPKNYEEYKLLLKGIIYYWSKAIHPDDKNWHLL